MASFSVEEGSEYPTERFNILGWHYEQAIQCFRASTTSSTSSTTRRMDMESGLQNYSDLHGKCKMDHFLKTFEIEKSIKRAIIQGIAAN